VYGDEVSREKPAPDLFLLAAEKLKVIPSTCVDIEDSWAGIEVALSARMQVIMVPDLQPAQSFGAYRGEGTMQAQDLCELSTSIIRLAQETAGIKFSARIYSF